MSDDEFRERLDRLESLVEQQQETITDQRNRIDDQQAIIEEQRDRIAELEGSATEDDETGRESPISRRSALKAGGLVGLLGLGAGTASADPQGQIGTSRNPLEALYTAELNGSVTGEQALTDLLGTGLSINSGTLDASEASSWADGDADDILEPKSPYTGIDVADVQTGSLNGSVTNGTDVTDLLGPGLTTTSNSLTADLGNGLGFDGSNRVEVPTNAIGSDELAPGAVPATEADVTRTFTESDVTVTTDGTTVNAIRGAIETTTSPSTATRPDDSATFDYTTKQGIEINPNLDLTAIELEISSMTSGETTVYVLDSSENIIAQKSSPGSGNTVTFRTPLSAGTTYYVAVDAGGATYTIGYVPESSLSFPYTSTTVDITGGYQEFSSSDDANAIDDVTGYPVGRATVEWSDPASVSQWDTAAFQTAADGEIVEVFVETSGDGGSTWSTWDPDGDGTPEPIAPGTDLSSIPAGDRIRFRVEIIRFDGANDPRLTLLSRQWSP